MVTDVAYSLVDPRVRVDVTRNLSLIVGALIVAALLMLAVLGPSLDRADPLAINLPYALAGPSKGHPFGCDALGRDIAGADLCGARGYRSGIAAQWLASRSLSAA